MIRNQTATLKQCAEHAVADLLSNGRASTDAKFPVAFVDAVIEVMSRAGYRESYAKSPEFEAFLRNLLNTALRDHRPANGATKRNIQRELVSSDVAKETKVACLSASARTSLPRPPFSHEPPLMCESRLRRLREQTSDCAGAAELLVENQDLLAELNGRSALLRPIL